MNKNHRLQVLSEEWSGCTKCDLSKLRRGAAVCMEVGNPDGDYLFIMDAPSESDALARMPLSGEKEADMMEDILDITSIGLDEASFINVVGCRAGVAVEETEFEEARIIDRPPKAAHYKACGLRMEQLIHTLDPRVIVIMSEEAYKYLVTNKAKGTFNTYAKAAKTGELFWSKDILGRGLQYPVVVAYSPERILRNPSVAKHGPHETAIRTMHSTQKLLGFIKESEVD